MNRTHRTKFNNRKKNGFDSRAEEKRNAELELLQKAGVISCLQRQVKYILIPSQYGEVKGKRTCIERPCCYYADFVYKDAFGNLVVEDVKGFTESTAYNLYSIKRKLMLQVYGIRIHELKLKGGKWEEKWK